MPSSLDAPYGTTLAAVKGIAIASSFVFAGHLATVTAFVPSLYVSADYSHRLAAQQFTYQYRCTKKTVPPTILATGLAYGALAYLALREDGRDALRFKLWTGAAASVLATIPWTILLLEPPTQKLLWVGEVADSATKTVGGPPSSTGIGVKVVAEDEDEATSRYPNGLLAPTTIDTAAARGSITPIDEFEPFEDAIVGEEYEQLKVKKLLQRFGKNNYVKVLMPLAAGCMGLAAVFLE